MVCIGFFDWKMTCADSLIARRPRKGISLLGNLDVQNGGFTRRRCISQKGSQPPHSAGMKPPFCTSKFPNKEIPFRGLRAISAFARVIFQSKTPMQTISSIYSGCENTTCARNRNFARPQHSVRCGGVPFCAARATPASSAACRRQSPITLPAASF